jgi:hypothetical protein
MNNAKRLLTVSGDSFKKDVLLIRAVGSSLVYIADADTPYNFVQTSATHSSGQNTGGDWDGDQRILVVTSTSNSYAYSENRGQSWHSLTLTNGGTLYNSFYEEGNDRWWICGSGGLFYTSTPLSPATWSRMFTTPSYIDIDGPDLSGRLRAVVTDSTTRNITVDSNPPGNLGSTSLGGAFYNIYYISKTNHFFASSNSTSIVRINSDNSTSLRTATTEYNSFASDGNVIVQSGRSSTVWYYSYDGLDWTSFTGPNIGGTTWYYHRHLVWNGKFFVAQGANGTFYSSDGISGWTQSGQGVSAASQLRV